jgi:hypothetical protein
LEIQRSLFVCVCVWERERERERERKESNWVPVLLQLLSTYLKRGFPVGTQTSFIQ